MQKADIESYTYTGTFITKWVPGIFPGGLKATGA